MREVAKTQPTNRERLWRSIACGAIALPALVSLGFLGKGIHDYAGLPEPKQEAPTADIQKVNDEILLSAEIAATGAVVVGLGGCVAMGCMCVKLLPGPEKE